jgi:hypothetical protein
MGLTLGPAGWTVLLIYPAQIVRQMLRNRGPLRRRAALASFHMLARFPEALGQLKFLYDRLLGIQGRLIEYK